MSNNCICDIFQILPGEEPPEQPLPVPTKPAQTEKEVKKKKFVPLFSKEGQALSVVQLAGNYSKCTLYLAISDKLQNVHYS